ncbi:MAG: hypothetical protein L6Q99_03185 [Planctomycetes bacterium]|nr:hypothetical protein [Planctomycetota bacterium]
MEIRSQPVGPNDPKRRVDITRPTREALKEGVEQTVSEQKADAASEAEAKAQRIKNAREEHREALQRRTHNAREEAATEDRIQNAREEAIRERIQNARAERKERVENARDVAEQNEAQRVKNARGRKDEVRISLDVRRTDEERAAKLQSLKELHDAGKLHDEERLARAAERLLAGDE